MITDYINPTTCFPCILTNEFGSHSSILAVQKLPAPPLHSLYIGVSGFFNYNLIALRKPSRVFLVDCNPYIAEVHSILKKVIVTSSDPKNCLSAFFQEIDKRPLSHFYYCQRGSAKAEILEELSHPTSWLGSQEAFSTIQRLYQEKRIEIWMGNLLDPKTISLLQNKIQEAHLNIDLLYLSNCEDSDWESSCNWQSISRDAQPLFSSIRKAISPLLQPTSYVLVARNADYLVQKIYRPGAYLQGKEEYIFRYRHPMKLQCRFFLDQHQQKLLTSMLVIFSGVIAWKIYSYTHLS